jgi:hypothetical protein
MDGHKDRRKKYIKIDGWTEGRINRQTDKKDKRVKMD